MRSLLFLSALGPVAASTAAQSALPPQYQRAAEFRAVAADSRIADAFGGAPIERIEHVGPDLYRVSAGRCRLDIAIVDLPMPPGVAGPRRFAVKAGRKACGR